MKTTLTFEVYPNHPLRAVAIVNEQGLVSLKLKGCKIPKGFYNSALNDAYKAYEEQFLN